MVKFAVLECARLAFVCASAAQYCKAVWFCWVWEDWAWVEQTGGAICCQVLEDFLSLRLRRIVEEVAGVSLLVCVTCTRNAAVGGVSVVLLVAVGAVARTW